LTVAEVNEARVEEFFVWQRANWRHRKSWSRPGLRCLLDVLRGLGVLAAEEPAVPSSPTDVLLACFERYLLSERGSAGGTVVLYLRSARRFVCRSHPLPAAGGRRARHDRARALAQRCCGQ
jgi:integrase/recombinase XerD